MKGNADLLVSLNSLLADELTAINQYMVHAEICENWGYYKLHKSIEKQAFDEMQHAEWLIQRIIFLEGIPIVSKINQISIGKTVPEMIKNDYDDELTAVHSYNEAINLARNIKDQASVDLLSKILRMEEDHVDWAEAQNDQIAQMGIQNYLAIQLNKEN
jgi:bacterioferritin